MASLLLIIDAATGGRFKPADWGDTHDEDDFGYYGNYNTNGMIPIYCEHRCPAPECAVPLSPSQALAVLHTEWLSSYVE